MTNPLHEVAKIMGVDEETLGILPKIKYPRNLLNPWGDALLDAFRPLLSPGKAVLDIPCGQGGVSVCLAKEYGVTVDGSDLFQGFIDNANAYAAEQHVQALCHFRAEDIRTAISRGKAYDAVLWSAPPHLWADYAQTVAHLRKCVKPGGYLVIADAYAYTSEIKAQQPDYETLEETLQSVSACGDTIIACTDYKGTLWAQNHQSDREAVARAIRQADTPAEKALLEKYLESLYESEQVDTASFGLYILVLQVTEK